MTSTFRATSASFGSTAEQYTDFMVLRVPLPATLVYHFIKVSCGRFEKIL
jgi:hypothetical protein